jgi:5-methyltetrahydrofolate--homocysteine methyltransferase
VKGDFHEIGKDLVRIFLEINGFNVVDLGVDVPPEDFVRAFQTTHAKVIGLSAFLTSDRKQLTTVIDMFGKENGKKNIVVGGAAVNQSIADRIGANGYAKNAVEAVSVIKNLLTKTRVV